MRERFTSTGLSQWLDTAAGLALSAAYGSRQGAAAALQEQEAIDRAWRRQRAEERFERFPEHWESPSHAMASVPDPVGGCGASMSGTTDEIVSAFRAVDPGCRARNLGEPDAETAIDGYVVGRDGVTRERVDFRPPWARAEA